jgi:hypothetical protein
MKDNRKQDRVMALVVIALICVVASAGFHRWYTSDEGQQTRFVDDLAAMPGVDRAANGRIDLADDVTLDEARAVHEALDRDVPGLDVGGWRMSHGAAELVVSPGFVRAGTDGVDLTTLLGAAGVLDDHDVAVEISDALFDHAQITLTGPDADRLSTATAVIDALADHPDLVPPRIDLYGGPAVTLLSAEALRDPARVAEDLAAIAEVSDLDPWVSLTAERFVWFKVAHRSDAAPARERLRAALSGAPDEFDIRVVIPDTDREE